MLTPESLNARLAWRYATKRFDADREIPADHWAALENSLVTSPSSFGLQPWKFIVVDDTDLREQLKAASWNQTQTTEAARFVVFAGKRSVTAADIDRLIDRTGEIRGVPAESLGGYRNMLLGFVEKGWAAKDHAGWNARQVYIALGQFMTAAATLGVDTCPMEGIDMAAYDRILGLEGGDYGTLCACAAGYRHAEDKYATLPKVRYATDEIIERR
ncbi:MAG: NAD(P)H-dependent oxidoreductase [Planctomycetes bacterium]|nr:NAD(P)H-dependent oxidoreductase [Planctomycetota bacterium]